jgi:formate hydrogenlyase subunit 6/NADH:ubiquinone oxidoreductase subunit I
MTTIGAMLGDILQSLFKRPATERYPFKRYEASSRLRGQLYYDPAKCSGCALCTKDCPSQALELITVDKATKHFVIRYHIDRCTFCAQCVESCRFNCLGMSAEDWELASVSKEPFDVHYGRAEDLEKLLGSAAAGDPTSPGEG